MTWIKLDDALVDHPKIIGLKDDAFRAYISALCYASRFLTDGHIPTSALAKITNSKATQSLIKAGLWHQTEDGIVINDFLDYNPSREDTHAKRAAAAERMKRIRTQR